MQRHQQSLQRDKSGNFGDFHPQNPSAPSIPKNPSAPSSPEEFGDSEFLNLQLGGSDPPTCPGMESRDFPKLREEHVRTRVREPKLCGFSLKKVLPSVFSHKNVLPSVFSPPRPHLKQIPAAPPTPLTPFLFSHHLKFPDFLRFGVWRNQTPIPSPASPSADPSAPPV